VAGRPARSNPGRLPRPVALLGAALVGLGLAVFTWKVGVHEMPVFPSEAENVWRVELQVDVTGMSQRGSVEIQLPSSSRSQEVYDERVDGEGLDFEVRGAGSERVGVFRGSVSGMSRLTHSFRVRLGEGPARNEPSAPALAEGYLGPASGVPVGAPELDVVLERLRIDWQDDPAATVRRIFAFVAEEIDSVAIGSNDALITLVAREGSQVGQAKLLTAMLRRVGVPARLATGLRLAAPREERETVYVEASLDGEWVPLFPALGQMGRPPDHLLAMGRTRAGFVEVVGFEAAHHRFRIAREGLRPEELKAVMLPPNRVLGFLSLYRFPLGTQLVLGPLLAIPLAALLVACVRNLIGLQTFGTFLPILIPLSLRETGLGIGVAMVGFLIGSGVLGRLLIERFRLLFVPRLCVLLCLVILQIVALALVGYSIGSADVLSGVLFPIVILTMLIERVSITVAEEGAEEAGRKLLSTLLVVVLAYPVFRVEDVSQLFFGFPELVLVVMGVLVWIGGYRGYRVSELLRFRSLAAVDTGGTA